MSIPILFCGDSDCGGCRLHLEEIGVWMCVGPNAVSAGDVYGCPTCSKKVVVGAEKFVTMYDNEELVRRVQAAILTAGTPYVSHQYVVESH